MPAKPRPRRGARATRRASPPARPAAGKNSKKGTGTARKTRPASGRRKASREATAVVTQAGPLTISEVEELDGLRRELEAAAKGSPLRWNADPDDVQRSVAQLVLTLVEFIRKVLERQAIRRMEAGTLTDEQTEDVGRALMKLEEAVRDIAGRFGLDPDDLNLDLGPVGRLM